MKWRRNKSSPSSSPSSSILSRVFPVSWFSKSKHKGGNLGTPSDKDTKRCEELDFQTPISGSRQGRFYSMDEDDAFWRLSFGEERLVQQGRRSTGGINPLWYDHSVSELKSFDSREMDFRRTDHCLKFSDMVLDIKKTKEKELKQKATAENNGGAFAIQSRKDVKDQIFNTGETDIFPVEQENTAQIKRDFSNSRKQQKIRSTATSDRVSMAEWQNSEEKKLKEIKVKTEYGSRRTKQNNNRVKAYSPRTECKIRALEEMKKARMRLKKKREPEEQVMDETTIFDSFAVVKSSFDPLNDFRDSMMEMIREKGIGKAEDLEQLLACYLTLNRDEYHDLIIKVFRQVWLEVNGVCINPRNTAQCQYFD